MSSLLASETLCSQITSETFRLDWTMTTTLCKSQ